MNPRSHDGSEDGAEHPVDGLAAVAAADVVVLAVDVKGRREVYGLFQ